jgi:hypothetical protein
MGAAIDRPEKEPDESIDDWHERVEVALAVYQAERAGEPLASLDLTPIKEPEPYREPWWSTIALLVVTVVMCVGALVGVLWLTIVLGINFPVF